MTDRASDALIASALAQLGEQRSRLDDLERLIASASGLLRDSALGSGESPLLPSVELVHGQAKQWEFWQSVVALRPESPMAIFPDFRVVLDLVVGKLGLEASQELGDAGVRTRLVTDAGQLSDPLVRENIGQFAALGIEIRTTKSPPSFLLIVPGRLAVLPLEWGQSLPETLVVIRDSVLVDALGASYDDLWDHALPLPTAHRERDQVLRLMAQGLTDTSIADALGMSVRSVRRRVAEAAAEWGVSSRFALGAEWGRGRR